MHRIRKYLQELDDIIRRTNSAVKVKSRIKRTYVLLLLNCVPLHYKRKGLKIRPDRGREKRI